ncbi:MAG TPA: ABC transporter permease subunit, partial [Paracoccaceae bacterium]|nr:ABC transporter permease subunit [Paracoccaceae bacterium]
MPQGLVTLVSLAALWLVWSVGARVAGDPVTLPGPEEVFLLLLAEAEAGRLWLHLGATLARVVAAFLLAMSIGLGLGILMGRFGRFDRWLDPWLVVLLNLPALVVIVLCYIWIGLTEAAAVAAVAVNKIPMVTAMIREGVRALDPSLDAMARVFRMGPAARLAHVVLPQLAPHIASAARSGVALIWKIVLVVEFLGRPNGIGFQIHLYFQLFEVGRVLAYAIAFILVMLAVEKLLMQ